MRSEHCLLLLDWGFAGFPRLVMTRPRIILYHLGLDPIIPFPILVVILELFPIPQLQKSQLPCLRVDLFRLEVLEGFRVPCKFRILEVKSILRDLEWLSFLFGFGPTHSFRLNHSLLIPHFIQPGHHLSRVLVEDQFIALAHLVPEGFLDGRDRGDSPHLLQSLLDRGEFGCHVQPPHLRFNSLFALSFQPILPNIQSYSLFLPTLMNLSQPSLEPLDLGLKSAS